MFEGGRNLVTKKHHTYQVSTDETHLEYIYYASQIQKGFHIHKMCFRLLGRKGHSKKHKTTIQSKSQLYQ